MSAHLCWIAWNEPIGRAELYAILGVGDADLQTLLGAAHREQSQAGRGEPIDQVQDRLGPIGITERIGRHRCGAEVGQPQRLVHRYQTAAGQTRTFGVNRKQT